MLNTFPLVSSYAETHYKFKLPWSPLFKPWPEIFLDAPSVCCLGKSLPIYLVVKDADFFPVIIQEIEIHVRNKDQSYSEQIPLDLAFDQNLTFFAIPFNSSKLSGE